MQTCPHCHNEGWQPTTMRDHPIENIGGTQRYGAVTIRRYLCHNCGSAHYTHETWGERISLRGLKTLAKLAEPSLFDDEVIVSAAPATSPSDHG